MRLFLSIALTAFSQIASAVPTVFEAGTISGPEHEAAPAFSPDEKSIYFQRSDSEHSTILTSDRVNGAWSAPVTAPFSGRWNDMEPAFSADGNYIVFASSRPIDPAGQPIDGFFGGVVQKGGGGNLWRVDRRRDGSWGTPRRLPDTVNAGTNVFAPSLLGDGTLFFMRPDPGTHRFRLYSSTPGPKGYQAAIPLPFSTGATTDVDPVVSRDGRFIVFASGRPPAVGMDLFVSRRTSAGWSEPQHLGVRVNSPGSDAEPRLSPDEQTLYFSSERKVADSTADWNSGKYNIWTIPIADALPPPR